MTHIKDYCKYIYIKLPHDLYEKVKFIITLMHVTVRGKHKYCADCKTTMIKGACNIFHLRIEHGS